MRFVCIAKCVFRGEVVRPGTELDLDPAALAPCDLSMLRGSFQETEAGKVKPGAAEKLSNGLTREQAVSKLEASGVPVPEGLDGAALAEFYVKVFGKRADGKEAEVPPVAPEVPPVAPEVPPVAPEVPPVEMPPVAPDVPPVAKVKKASKKGA